MPALMVLPSMMLIAILFFYPIVDTIKLSFYKWNGILQSPPKFIGFKNYEVMFRDEAFWTSIKNVGCSYCRVYSSRANRLHIGSVHLKKIRGILL